MIERLGGHGFLEELNTNLHHPAVPDHRLEILLRQRQGGGYGHAGTFAFDYPSQHIPGENQIPVHQDQIVPQQLPGAVD